MGSSIEEMAQSMVLQFLKSKGGLSNRVKTRMAEILRKNAQAGIVVSLQEAFDQATLRTSRN